MPPPTVNNDLKNQFLAGEELPSGVPRQFLLFSLIAFFAALILFAGLRFGYQVFLENAIEDLEAEVDRLGGQVTSEQQASLARLYSQVANLETLLEDHVFASELFPVLEANTHSRVAYRALEVSVPDREVAIEGLAGSYDDLVAQLALFERAPAVERLVLEDSQAEGSTISFRVILTMESGFFEL